MPSKDYHISYNIYFQKTKFVLGLYFCCLYLEVFVVALCQHSFYNRNERLNYANYISFWFNIVFVYIVHKYLNWEHVIHPFLALNYTAKAIFSSWHTYLKKWKVLTMCVPRSCCKRIWFAGQWCKLTSYLEANNFLDRCPYWTIATKQLRDEWSVNVLGNTYYLGNCRSVRFTSTTWFGMTHCAPNTMLFGLCLLTRCNLFETWNVEMCMYNFLITTRSAVISYLGFSKSTSL